EGEMMEMEGEVVEMEGEVVEVVEEDALPVYLKNALIDLNLLKDKCPLSDLSLRKSLLKPEFDDLDLRDLEDCITEPMAVSVLLLSLIILLFSFSKIFYIIVGSTGNKDFLQQRLWYLLPA